MRANWFCRCSQPPAPVELSSIWFVPPQVSLRVGTVWFESARGGGGGGVGSFGALIFARASFLFEYSGPLFGSLFAIGTHSRSRMLMKLAIRVGDSPCHVAVYKRQALDVREVARNERVGFLFLHLFHPEDLHSPLSVCFMANCVVCVNRQQVQRSGHLSGAARW